VDVVGLESVFPCLHSEDGNSKSFRSFVTVNASERFASTTVTRWTPREQNCLTKGGMGEGEGCSAG
jgi:hypothetical protein